MEEHGAIQRYKESRREKTEPIKEGSPSHVRFREMA
jgi:hypothetical protein